MTLLRGRERLPLSVVGWPIEGAGDEAKMGTSGSLSECYLSRLSDVGVNWGIYRRSGQRRELWYTRAISIVVPRMR
jgi:hypothetical protein